MEDIHRRRRRRKTRMTHKCAVEVHSGEQCIVRIMKHRNKAREESDRKGRMTT
jgi:hypothetical protein